MDTSVSGFTAGPSGGSRQPHAGPRDRNPARVQFAAGLPEERSGVDFGTRFQSLPTNPAFFFPDMLAQDLTGEPGEEEEEGGKKREGGKTAPGLEEDIVCMCTQAQGLWPAA